jgi:transcriptional regulator NrdR family protein
MIVINMQCPFCDKKVVARSRLDHIYMARRICEACNEEFLIVDDKPVKPENYEKTALTEGTTVPERSGT